jgi:hypothetical protein
MKLKIVVHKEHDRTGSSIHIFTLQEKKSKDILFQFQYKNLHSQKHKSNYIVYTTINQLKDIEYEMVQMCIDFYNVERQEIDWDYYIRPLVKSKL